MLDLSWNPETDDLAPALARMRREKVQAVLTWSDARTSALLLRRMREQGLRAAFVGGDGIVNDEFAGLAPRAAGAVLAAAACAHSDPKSTAMPSSPGDHSYLATAHLLAAIEVAGPGRKAVREELQRKRRDTVARFEGGVWRVGSASEISLGTARAQRRSRRDQR